MKKLLLLACGIFISCAIFGQISERTIPVTPVKQHEEKYDTLTNFPKWDLLVGQSLFMLPLDETVYNSFPEYDCFWIQNNDKYLEQEDIENKVFKVISYEHSSPYEVEPKDRKQAGAIFLLLSENNDTVIWHIPYFPEQASSITHLYKLSSKNPKLPILVMSYIDKIKSESIGRNFYAKNTIDRNDFKHSLSAKINEKELVDLSTGTPLSIKKEDIFSCIDLTLINSDTHYKQPYLIFSDSLKNEFRVAFMPLIGDPYHRLNIDRFYTEFEYASLLEKRKNESIEEERKRLNLLDEFVKKYGKSKGTLIANGEVRLGMTSNMCIDAKGEPNSVNRTIVAGKTNEQWVYDYEFLYFENGILTAIQD